MHVGFLVHSTSVVVWITDKLSSRRLTASSKPIGNSELLVGPDNPALILVHTPRLSAHALDDRLRRGKLKLMSINGSDLNV